MYSVCLLTFAFALLVFSCVPCALVLCSDRFYASNVRVIFISIMYGFVCLFYVIGFPS